MLLEPKKAPPPLLASDLQAQASARESGKQRLKALPCPGAHQDLRQGRCQPALCQPSLLTLLTLQSPVLMAHPMFYIKQPTLLPRAACPFPAGGRGSREAVKCFFTFCSPTQAEESKEAETTRHSQSARKPVRKVGEEGGGMEKGDKKSNHKRDKES